MRLIKADEDGHLFIISDKGNTDISLCFHEYEDEREPEYWYFINEKHEATKQYSDKEAAISAYVKNNLTFN